MTTDALVTNLNGGSPASSDHRLRTLRAEATKLVGDVAGPLKHVALRCGDCAVELTWADPPTVTVASPDPGVPATTGEGAGTFAVVAPLVGVFYGAPSPGAKVFVTVGDRVGADQVVGIIEAMKLMNHITAGVAGIVAEVLVGDGQPVEFGQELVRVLVDPEPADA